MKAYTPPLSLWRLVEQHVPQHEHEEIKSMLGASLVEQSQELHEEIEMLLDIWREMRDENTESISPQSTLPEPPDQRDRLVQEICFFVNSVKEKAKEKGIDPQFIFKRHNSLVLDYAAELTRPESAAQRASSSSSSLDGRETPLLSSTDNRETLAVEITDEVEAANKKLNYLDFAEVCDNLRSTLEREVDQLMNDIQFLQSCLDSEADFRDSPASNLSREPTLSELREERSQLEKDLVATNRITATPHVTKPSFNFSNMALLSTQPDLSASSLQTSRSSPLRGDHNLMGALRGEPEIVSSAPGTSVALNCQIKDVHILKTPFQTHQKNSASAVEDDTSFDRNTKLSKSSSNQTQHTSSLSLKETSPSSSPSTNKKDVQKNLRRLPGTKISQNIEGHKQSHLSPTISVKKRDSSKVTMGVVRRTGSPGRVRVVELNAVVSSLSKRDNNTTEFSPSPTSSSDISPSATSPLVSIDSPMRPHSAHADRFRKMVLRCRDGD